MHISVCSVTYCYSSQHVSVTAVTIISVAYNNNTINIQIIVQKCTIKQPGVTLDIVQWMLLSWSIVNYMFTFLLKYSKIGCVDVVQCCVQLVHTCNTESVAVGTVQCYQHSVCNNCIFSRQLHTCWISEAVHSRKDRLLGIVVSQELTAPVFSATVCGKAAHLFLLSDNLSFVTSIHLWTMGWFDYADNTNEMTGSGNGQLSDKIITACLNTLTHWHANKHSLKCEMSIAEHLWPL